MPSNMRYKMRILKYPNHKIRFHNLTLELSIKKLEDKIVEFQEQENFLERSKEIEKMVKGGIPVDQENFHHENLFVI